jgi:hypothetical protein
MTGLAPCDPPGKDSRGTGASRPTPGSQAAVERPRVIARITARAVESSLLYNRSSLTRTRMIWTIAGKPSYLPTMPGAAHCRLDSLISAQEA